MTSTMVHIRIDKELKEEACAKLELMGLSLSEAVRLLLIRIARENVLPFEIRVPNAKTKQAISCAKNDEFIKFNSIEELINSDE